MSTTKRTTPSQLNNKNAPPSIIIKNEPPTTATFVGSNAGANPAAAAFETVPVGAVVPVVAPTCVPVPVAVAPVPTPPIPPAVLVKCPGVTATFDSVCVFVCANVSGTFAVAVLATLTLAIEL